MQKFQTLIFRTFSEQNFRNIKQIFPNLLTLDE